MCKNKISSILLVAVMIFSAALVSCGGQDPEKLRKVQENYGHLVDGLNITTNLVERASSRGLINNALIDEYNVLVRAVNEFGEINLNEATNDELDYILSEIYKLVAAVADVRIAIESLF